MAERGSRLVQETQDISLAAMLIGMKYRIKSMFSRDKAYCEHLLRYFIIDNKRNHKQYMKLFKILLRADRITQFKSYKLTNHMMFLQSDSKIPFH